MCLLPYAGTTLQGCAVRIVGLLLIALAGSASASEDRHEPGLARFAYANTAVFQRSFGELVPKRPVEPEPPEAAVSKSADFRPVLLVAAETIVSNPVEVTESAKSNTIDGIETVTLVREINGSASPQESAQQIAALEPSALPSENAPPLQLAAQIAELGPSSSPAEAVTEVRQTGRELSKLEPSSVPSESLPTVQDQRQQLAALAPPSHLSDSAPDEVLTARSNQPVHAPPILKRTHRKSVHASAHKSAHSAKKKVAAATVPKWATKMFEGPWQQHAFAYQ